MRLVVLNVLSTFSLMELLHHPLANPKLAATCPQIMPALDAYMDIGIVVQQHQPAKVAQLWVANALVTLYVMAATIIMNIMELLAFHQLDVSHLKIYQLLHANYAYIITFCLEEPAD